MLRIKIVVGIFAVYSLLSATGLHAAYYLDGKVSKRGAYAYETVAKGSPGGWDENKGKALTFGYGALIDGSGDDYGKGIRFPHSPRGSQMKRIYIDLGQDVVLKSLVVKSRLDAWWTIGKFFVESAGEDGKFGNKVVHTGANLSLPHEQGKQVECELSFKDTRARYLKLTFVVPMWNHVQLDEIDIRAELPKGQKPISYYSLRNFREWVAGQTIPPLVDKFGQWIHEDWNGKIQNEKELAKQINDEIIRYSKVERDLRKFDRFGGSKTLGFTSNATGKWRLEKIKGRWWFITPEGNPFIFIGVDGVNCWSVNTVEHPDRPELPSFYEWLPPKDGEFAGCWTYSIPSDKIWRFDFFRANMIRAFGNNANLDDKLYDLIESRLIDWGFNALGKWSEVNHILSKIGRPMPYIRPIDPAQIEGITLHTVNGMFDPWDSNYIPAVEATIKKINQDCANDKFLVGVAFYGENWWGTGATAAMLSARADSPAKRAFCELLIRKYNHSLEQINKDLGSSWASFEEMYAANLTSYSKSLEKYISPFIESSSKLYFSAWRNAINKYSPGLLLLGACFVPTWPEYASPEWIKGSIPFCDAMMLDEYSITPASVLNNYVQKYAVPADKPVLLGEYSVTTCERGFNDFTSDVRTQKERGETYKKLNEAYFANPNWVGSMWFVYRDQVLLGRDKDGYGECHNFGLVDTCNLPYYDMINIMKETNTRLFEIHAGKDIAK